MNVDNSVNEKTPKPLEEQNGKEDPLTRHREKVPGLITGTDISCANWQIEAMLRMILNNLAQGAKPQELIIYGGRGRAARSWEAFDAIVRTLHRMQPHQTMLIQSGKPVGVLDTHKHSPRALIANSMLVPRWATDEHFWPLEEREAMMYGQMTAGSWAFIGQQGIMQGTHETFVGAGAGPGKFLFTSGLGNMGGAQAPAGKMTGATVLIAEMDASKIRRCQAEGWIDEAFTSIEDAVLRVIKARNRNEAIAIAVHANVIDVLDYMHLNDVTPDILTDQTAAHDLHRGYFPEKLSFDEAMAMREDDPEGYVRLCKKSTAVHVGLMLALQARGATTFDYGNGIRFHAEEQGMEDAFDIQGFVPLYVRPLFCQGRGPFRVVALSGNPADIAVIDKIILDEFGDNELLRNWIQMAQGFIDFDKQPGLPARVCWLGMGERARAVELIWRAIRDGRISAPIWVGRDHLDCGSVASPGRETEGMMDGSDAVADWAILNALISVASGSTWTSVHDGGGVGIGLAIHSGQCFVITPDTACLERAIRVFTNDPASGIIRHADAGYPEAIVTGLEHDIWMPMLDKPAGPKRV